MARSKKELLLRHAMRRAATEDDFVAAALAAYQRQNGMDDVALAKLLECPVGDLPRLALCGRPDARSPAFGSDVRRIAEYAGVNPIALARILRDVDATQRLRQVAESAPERMLMAARDAAMPGAELHEQRAPSHSGALPTTAQPQQDTPLPEDGSP